MKLSKESQRQWQFTFGSLKQGASIVEDFTMIIHGVTI